MMKKDRFTLFVLVLILVTASMTVVYVGLYARQVRIFSCKNHIVRYSGDRMDIRGVALLTPRGRVHMRLIEDGILDVSGLYNKAFFFSTDSTDSFLSNDCTDAVTVYEIKSPGTESRIFFSDQTPVFSSQNPQVPVVLFVAHYYLKKYLLLLILASLCFGFMLLILFRIRQDNLIIRYCGWPKARLFQYTFALMPAIILFSGSFMVRYAISDKQYEQSYEPDTDEVIYYTSRFAQFFSSPSRNTFPEGFSGSTYLDGPYVVNGLVASFSKAFIELSGNGKYFSGNVAIVIFITRMTNILYCSLSMLLIFFLLRRISGNYLLSFFISVVYVLFSPVILQLDNARVDNFMFFGVVLSIFFTVRILESPGKKWQYLMLGIAFALAFATKLNTFFYVHVPLTLVLIFFSKRGTLKNLFYLCLPVFLLLLSFLMVRWIVHYQQVPSNIRFLFSEAGRWFASIPANPLFYHFYIFMNDPELSGLTVPSGVKDHASLYELLSGSRHAVAGFALVLFSLAGYIVSLFRSFRPFDKVMGPLIIIFMVYSAGLLVSPTISRYGIFMPVFYAFFFMYLIKALHMNRGRKFLRYLRILVLIVPVVYIFSELKLFSGMLLDAKGRERAYEELRMAPRKWLDENVRHGSRIMRITADISSYPPVFDLNYRFTERNLFGRNSNLLSDSLQEYLPPTSTELEANADILISVNTQVDHYLHLYEFFSLRNPGLLDDSSAVVSFFHKIPEISNEEYGRTDAGFAENLYQIVRKELPERLWEENTVVEDALTAEINSVRNDSAGNFIVDNLQLMLPEIDFSSMYYRDYISYTGGTMYLHSWKNFFSKLEEKYPVIKFSSTHHHYHMRWVKFHIVNKKCLIK
jgi:hypothetical protein